ncbi:MAG: TonB-dependent receptor [Bacteroidetes bacterium]|nr:TonB-dependent receptor [Bacteroidota bacterium]
MKNFILLCLCLFALKKSQAQTISIFDQKTETPLEGVTLSSQSPEAVVVSNAAGQADISSFKNSPNIEIRYLGYKTENLSYAQLATVNFVVELTYENFNLNELVISASRWQQNSYDIPAKISTISPNEISLQNPQTAADLLNISGKVFIQKSQQGGGSPMIRGFSTNRLLYAVDGVRMNTAIFRGGNIQNVISLDPFAIENTEVLFGPGSVIYGSDAIGGVMSFQTLIPHFSLDNEPLIHGKAVTRYASANNEKTAHFDVNMGWKKWAMISSISSNDYGDLRMGSHGPTEYLRSFYVQRIDSVDVIVTNDDPKIQRPSAYSQMNIMQKLRFNPNDAWDFQYGFHYSETSDYARYDRHIRYKNGLPRYGEWNYGPQKWMMNQLSVSFSPQSGFFDEMNFRLAKQYFEESRISRDINKANRETRIEKVDAYSANLDLMKSLSEKNKLFYGLEYISNAVNSSGIDQNIVTGDSEKGASRYPQSTWASYGIYASDQHQFSETFLLQTSLRYNRYQLNADFDTTFYPFPFTTASLNEGALTGSLGFVYRPTEKWVISSNIATAFRAPNVDDIGKVFDSEPGAVTVPNPNLKAEYAYNADFNVAKIFGEKVKIDFSAYYTQLKNAMVRRNFALNGLDSIVYDGELSQVQAIQNAAIANVYGVQAGVEIKLPQGFTFTSDINFQKGEEELDDGTKSPSRHAPPIFGVSRLRYVYEKLHWEVYSTYSGARKYADMPEEEKGKDYIYATDENGNPYSPSWYTLNFKAQYKLSEQWTVSAGLENLTDQRYRPYSSGIVAAGRNFILAVRARF